ncbi:MAG TPA: sigma-70 family RNA polymerase sigma factor [Clostridiaceae bacterium]
MNISERSIKISGGLTDITLAKKGDKLAFERLIEEHKYIIYRVAKTRLHCKEDIEDVFQETIIKAYKGIIKLKRDEYFKTWIIRIMINECNILLRKRKEIAYIDNDIADNIKREDSNSNIEIFDLINSLEEDLKMVTLLYFYEDMPQKEIGKLLSIPNGTVRSRISRAKEKLRKIVKEQM